MASLSLGINNLEKLQTADKCNALYQQLSTRVATDTHQQTLADAKHFLKWCVEKRWLSKNPLDLVKKQGRRRHGKPQLRREEAILWYRKALEFANEGNQGAIAAIFTLIMGMRCSEIVSLKVRDINQGIRLHIEKSKTRAGERVLEIPDQLQPYLIEIRQGKNATDLLFGYHCRDWPRSWVKKICKAAGVPIVSAHSMRGLHRTSAYQAGVTPELIAKSLGHESFAITSGSYLAPGRKDYLNQQRILTLVEGGAQAQKAA